MDKAIVQSLFPTAISLSTSNTTATSSLPKHIGGALPSLGARAYQELKFILASL